MFSMTLGGMAFMRATMPAGSMWVTTWLMSSGGKAAASLAICSAGSAWVRLTMTSCGMEFSRFDSVVVFTDLGKQLGWLMG